MPRIAFGPVVRDVGLVLFDKDGTLLDFHRLWAPRTARAVAALAAAAGRPDLVAALAQTVGLSDDQCRIRPETPMAVAAVAANAVVAATVLHQAGIPWHVAETLARDHFVAPLVAPPAAEELAAVGDVAALLGALAAAGVKAGIVTTDDRAGTAATADRLGWSAHLVGLSCGDDPWPAKPDAAGLVRLCAAAGVDPAATAMVGDSLGDIAAARAAGCGLAVAVASGTGDPAVLAGAADVVIADVTAIRPA